MKKLSDYSYYRTGGLCQVLYEPESTVELSQILKDLHQRHTPFFVLGAGTNSLVWDDYFPGAVIIFSKMKAIRRVGNSLLCEAGADNTAIAQAALGAALGGISWMNRLPGQIGATVRMNARCYGGEISQVASTIKAVLPDGTIQVYTAADQVFKGYKDTVFMVNGAVVTEVTMSLSPGNKGLIAEHMRHCEDDRIKKGQFTYPSCGCVFKNNYAVGVPSGMLLDRAKAQTLNQPTIALNPQHSNFVYNKGASSQDILNFTLAMQELVFREYGVWMEYEMEILGLLSPDLQARVKEIRASVMNQSKVDALRQEFHKNSQTIKAEA